MPLPPFLRGHVAAGTVGLIGLVVFLAGLHIILRSQQLVALAGRDATILVVGRLDATDPFASGVVEAVRNASLQDADPLWVEVFDTSPFIASDTGGALRHPGRLRWRLYQRFALTNVAAVVDASTTSVAPSVIAASTNLGIPVLVTVATNNPVLAGGNGLALRMPGNDSAQAVVIASWVRQWPSVLLMYDGTPYARFLRRELIDQQVLHDRLLASQQVSSETDFLALFTEVKALGLTAVVFLGYGDALEDILTAHARLVPEIPILLSDGCYSATQEALPVAADQVFLSVPEAAESGQPEGEPFGAFGRDAYLLVRHAAKAASRERKARVSIVPTVKGLGTRATVLGAAGSYEWRETGENEVGRFVIRPLQELRKE